MFVFILIEKIVDWVGCNLFVVGVLGMLMLFVVFGISVVMLWVVCSEVVEYVYEMLCNVVVVLVS